MAVLKPGDWNIKMREFESGGNMMAPRKKPDLGVRFGMWLDPLLAERGKAAALAKLLDIASHQVSKMRYGQRGPQPKELLAIERFVGEQWPERHLLLGPEAAAVARPRQPNEVVPFVAKPRGAGVVTALHMPPGRMEIKYSAETDVFRPAKKGSSNMATAVVDTISAPQSEDYPGEQTFAVEVRDNSMDREDPPITKGTYALCVDFLAAKLVVTAGLVYLIKRSLDGGATWEFLIRCAQVYTDRIEWLPVSTEPGWEIITVPLAVAATAATVGVATVEVLGLVYGSYAPRSLRRSKLHS